MGTNIVQLTPEYFPSSSIGRPLASADIYVGKPDLDPEIVANQKQLSVQQESGTIVDVSQPISTSAGGIPLYSGSPVTLLVEGDYSLKVLDSAGSQIYYIPSLASQALIPGNFYYPDYSNADQGVVGNGDSVQDILTTVGTSTNATMYFAHTSGGATTSYVFGTSETITPNFNIIIEDGALLSVSTGETLTLNGPVSAGVFKIFSGAGVARFATTLSPTDTMGNIDKLYSTWWGTDTAGSAANNATAFNAALKAALESGINLYIPTGVYASDPIEYAHTGSSWRSGVKIYSGGMANNEATEGSVVLDFSGFSDVGAQVGINIDSTGSTGGGAINGIIFENITLLGPGNVASNTTKGLHIEGDATHIGSIFPELNNFHIKSFNIGFQVSGTNNWPLKVSHSSFQSCAIGADIDKSTDGFWDTVSFTGVVGIRFSASSTQTLVSCLWQSITRAVVFDTDDGNQTGFVFINPYFENVSESAFLIGYNADGTKSASNSLLRSSVIGGIYSTITNEIFLVSPGRQSGLTLLGIDGMAEWVLSSISGATQANPVVVTTRNAHLLSNDEKVYIQNVAGMTEINTTVFTAKNKTADTFELYNEAGDATINGGGYAAYTSGGQVLQNDDYRGPFSGGFFTPSTGSSTSFFFSSASGNHVNFLKPTATGFEINRGLTISDLPTDDIVILDTDEDGGDGTQFGASTLPIDGWIQVILGGVTHYIPTTKTEP